VEGGHARQAVLAALEQRGAEAGDEQREVAGGAELREPAQLEGGEAGSDRSRRASVRQSREEKGEGLGRVGRSIYVCIGVWLRLRFAPTGLSLRE
jgi:hypothetical protein